MKVGWLAFGLFLTAPILFGIPPLIGKVLWPNIHLLKEFSHVTKPDENIYIAVVLKYMPAGMVGIFLSAMLAASMSAMDSVWNAVSSIISVDIYKNMFNPNASEKTVLRVGRVTMIFLAVIAITLALVITHSSYGVFTFSNIFFGLTGVPVAIPLFLGIISRKISRWSAFSSILAGTLTASAGRFLLHYSIGQQYISTILVTLLFIYLSLPFGKLYLFGKKYAVAGSAALGGVLWTLSLVLNNTPALSFARVVKELSRFRPDFFLTATFWAFAVGIGFFFISYYLIY
jgi:Na+/proline symporter